MVGAIKNVGGQPDKGKAAEKTAAVQNLSGIGAAPPPRAKRLGLRLSFLPLYLEGFLPTDTFNRISRMFGYLTPSERNR